MNRNFLLEEFLKIFLHFHPKMFIYSPKISDDLFFFSHRPFPGFNMYFSVGGAKSVADINRGTKTLTFPQIHSRYHYSFCQLRRGPWPDWPPPGSAQVGGPKAAPFGPLDFLQVGGPRPTLALSSFQH